MKSRMGFTLAEMLVAMAISSTVILSSGMLIHQTVFFFDRGTNIIDENEALALAVDRLVRDFAAVRFVVTKIGSAGDSGLPPERVKAIFIAGAASEGATSLMFITAGGYNTDAQGEEVVKLSVEETEGATKLMRRQAAWPGPIVPLETVSLGDPVILLKGQFAISFSYGELTKGGELLWNDRWTGDKGLPHSVRMNLRDKVTDADLVPAIEFGIRADAPPSCTLAETECYLIASDIRAGTAQGIAMPQAGAVR
jgi:prepilin-type N-terminal cleavage/methylation domain-containing protein